MNRQFKNRMIGFEPTPKFNMGMFCCVHVNNIPPLALQDGSRKEFGREQTERRVKIPKEHLIGDISLSGSSI
jgi:hypothetical protein